MSQRKEKYLRRALNEANRLEGAAVELAAMGQRLERHLIGTDRRLAQNNRDTQQVRDELVRQRRRNRRVHRSEASTTRLALAAFTLAALALLVAMIRPLTVQEEATTPPVDSRATDMAAVAILRMEGLLEPEEDPEEAEKIDTALVAQGYLSDEIPLSYEEQDFLRTASSEGGVPYALALAVIETETGFRNVAGDEGGSIGYMQVAPRWHGERMERLGVADLWDPYGNFRVGCDFLGELLEAYGDQNKALMAYNMGPKRAAELWREGIYETEYSRAVMERAEAWLAITSNAGGTPGC